MFTVGTCKGKTQNGYVGMVGRGQRILRVLRRLRTGGKEAGGEILFFPRKWKGVVVL